MSIVTVCQAIQTIINADLASYMRAFDPPPASLDTAKLPAAWTFTGEAADDWLTLGSDGDRETRLYRVQVAVLPEGQANPELREARIRPLIGYLRDCLAAHPSLGGTQYVQSATVLGDSGIALLPEYGAKFVGFELRLQVIEYLRRTYANNE